MKPLDYKAVNNFIISDLNLFGELFKCFEKFSRDRIINDYEDIINDGKELVSYPFGRFDVYLIDIEDYEFVAFQDGKKTYLFYLHGKIYNIFSYTHDLNNSSILERVKSFFDSIMMKGFGESLHFDMYVFKEFELICSSDKHGNEIYACSYNDLLFIYNWIQKNI